MASANAPSLKGAHAQRGLCEPWESTTLIRTLPKRAKRQHSDTRENPSLCFQQFTPTPRKHGLGEQERDPDLRGCTPIQNWHPWAPRYLIRRIRVYARPKKA